MTFAAFTCHWNVRTLGGCLALAVTIGLTSPGVQIARAEGAAPTGEPTMMSMEAPASPDPGADAVDANADDAAICAPAAHDPNQPTAADVAAAIAKLEAQGADQDIVTFDGRGRNYRSSDDPMGEIQRIREEMRRERARARVGR